MKYKDLDRSLRKIIQSHDIKDQKEIVLALNKHGHEVNQSTVSRALKRIGAMKSKNRFGQMVYRINHDEMDFGLTGRSIGDLVFDVMANESMIVIKTSAGSASFVARYIDSFLTNEVIGTVAGDDTILVIPKSIKQILATIELIRTRLMI